MRILLFLSIWVLSFTQSLNAQTAQDMWAEKEAFITKHLSDPAPDEKQIVEGYKNGLLNEGRTVPTHEKLIEVARRAYWGKIFRTDNHDRLLTAKRNKAANGNASLGKGPFPNPELEETCELDIVIIVDRSGSLGNTNEANIQSGLLTMIQNQVGNGNTLTFIGMGDSGGNPILSETVTYNPGSINTHSDWINDVLFAGSCTQCDRWSTSLEAADGFNADLVMMVTNGNNGDNGHGANEPNLTIAAANVLKTNGENAGNGAHLFIIGEEGPGYTQGNLEMAVNDLIAPGATEAFGPLTLANVSSNDFTGIQNNFATLNTLLPNMEPCCSVEVGYISNRECVINNVYISGTYEYCSPLTVVSVDLQFWINLTNAVTVSADVNADGTWSFSSTRGEMEALGIVPGNWYDVVPVVTLSDGSVVTGTSYIGGLNNDLFFPPHANPSFILNDSPSDFTTSRTSFCEGTTIYYHGTDPMVGATGNHYPQIKRKLIGSTGPFAEWMGYGGVGASLDGYTGNLNNLWPGYLQVGYVYQLTIGSQDVANCVAWKHVTVEFEIVPCCAPDFFLAHVPECVESGGTFEVIVELQAPLSAEDIEVIYSSYNNYTYVSHTTNELDGSLLLFIIFEANTCSCEGEVLVFDIRLVDCPGIIWIMTDPIPCCAEECKTVSIEDWYAEDCIIVNGLPARYFCLEVSSDDPISAVYPTVPASVTCETEIVGLEFANIGGTNLYTICGYMVFTDPSCTFHAEVNLSLQTKGACCAIVQNFSFPKGCTLDKECFSAAPDIPIIQNSIISVSLDIPQGQTVSVFNVLTQSTTTYTVEEILCNPFGITSDGQLIGGVPCNGIFIPSDTPIDCRTTDDTPISLPYHLEVTWGDCLWTMIGDYCDEFIFYPGGVDTGIKRSSKVENTSNARSGEITVFPNPMDQSNILNFDFSELKTAVTNIQLTDISGKTIETIIPAQDQTVFQHQLDQSLSSGIYFLVFRLADGQLKSTKLVAVE